MIRPNSNVYFAKCFTHNGVDMQMIKVGLSYQPDIRADYLRSEMPFKFELLCSTPGDMFVEYFVHIWLREHKVSKEYFAQCEETDRIIKHVKTTGKLPFPIKFVSKEGMFSELRPLNYMAKHGISFREIEQLSGVSTQHHKKRLEKEPAGNRRFLAALAVTAVKKGLTINWARDFRPDDLETRIAA